MALSLMGMLTLVGCSDKSEAKPSEKESQVPSSAPAEKLTHFTTSFDMLSTWDYDFVAMNSFGMDPGEGMINLDNWGAKKLKQGEDGSIAGVGIKYDLTLDIANTDYELAIIAHIVGDEQSYSGSGDFSYTFKGPQEEVTDGYKLKAPTYCDVKLTGDIHLIGDPTDFANYLPDAPWEVDSNTSDDDEKVTKIKKKVLPSKLLTTVFLGATFKVSGQTISEVVDIQAI